jgi:hypothetical protein
LFVASGSAFEACGHVYVASERIRDGHGPGQGNGIFDERFIGDVNGVFRRELFDDMNRIAVHGAVGIPPSGGLAGRINN